MSVIFRMVGYYLVDYFYMSYVGLILMMFLMYIGGIFGLIVGGLKIIMLGVLLI